MDAILAVQANVYGGTHELMQYEFPVLGIKHTMVDPMDSSVWEDALQPGTKVCFGRCRRACVLRATFSQQADVALLPICSLNCLPVSMPCLS